MPRNTSRFVAAGLASLSLLAVPAAADAAPTKGLQDNAILSDDADLRASFFKDAKASKARTVRVLVNWDEKTTQAPADQIARIRRAAEEGRAARVKLLVGSYVTMGRGKRAGAKVSSSLQSKYVLFMGDVATQLKDLSLAGYLTFNEPNYKTAWPTRQERAWVKLSNRVYKQIKKNDRGAKVLVGEAAPNTRSGDASTNPGAFFRKALYLDSSFRPTSRSKAARTKLLGDGFTLHTYDFSRSPTKATSATDQWTHGNLRTTVRQIKALARAGRLSSTAARNIHITEFAYRTEGRFKTPTSRAASYLKSAFSLAKRNGIKTFIWYQLRDPKGRSDWKSGLKTSDGTSRRTWTIFRRLK
ncbi:cellulase family glycosylhydrolase [Patulibacter sp.]|uniref:cellulase family glycosylhydrolase n=1 Tax=Patulibacter sp. TaxID=1912859 RepID=UPI002717AF2C|nr:cellulase family glycosylhydrolase [Patulibacter sp.]MDO9409241.1 cellulase family glycosylhydrolase [Patulibacter sp.]